MSLDEIRKKIDGIDSKLIPLINERMDCSLEVAKIKRAENLPVYHPAREKEILDRVEASSEKYGPYVRNVYGSIMTVSRALQNDTLFTDSAFRQKIKSIPKSIEYKRVICQGAEGAFSQTAAKAMFSELPYEFTPSFEEVFCAIEDDSSAVGILPIENSTAGSVDKVYDLLLKYNSYIVRAVTIDVSQNLLCLGEPSQIKTVYSHPHALKQCSEYLEKHGIIAKEYKNTALAAKHVAELKNPSIGAIGSKDAGKFYGLKIGAENIQNENDNLTRFIAVSKTPFIAPDSNTVSLVLTVPHEKGSLYSMLGRFADCGLNLTKIESRPAGQKFECRFYIDFSGNLCDERTLNLLSSLDSELSYFVFLGNYRDN